MAIDRRAAIGLLTAGVAGAILPHPFHNRHQGPVYLSAHAGEEETYSAIGFLSSDMPVFNLALPDRGHSFVVSLTGRVAVHFSRRPGIFALVINSRTEPRWECSHHLKTDAFKAMVHLDQTAGSYTSAKTIS